MARRTARLRELAAHDLDSAVTYLIEEADETTAIDFVDAGEAAISRIARSPGIGTLRFADELGVPGLRAWPVPRYAYVIFYVPGEREIDVWRILHERRDLPERFLDR